MQKEILLTLVADIRVIDLGHDATINALHSQMADVEDSLQYYTAMHHRLDYVIYQGPGFDKIGDSNFAGLHAGRIY